MKYSGQTRSAVPVGATDTAFESADFANTKTESTAQGDTRDRSIFFNPKTIAYICAFAFGVIFWILLAYWML